MIAYDDYDTKSFLKASLTSTIFVCWNTYVCDRANWISSQSGR